MLATHTADPDEIERFSRIADEWWDEHGKFRPLHRMGPVRLGYLKEHACAHFGRDIHERFALKDLSVLDIGCGGGLLSEPMTRMGANVTGIDASERNIAVAALHANNMGLPIDYRATTPEALLAESSSPDYDIVLALEIIEHVADIPAFLQACCGLVRPGGLLFVSTLNRTFKSFGLAIVGAEYVLRWLPRGTHDWKKFVTPAELCAGLRHQHFDTLHMTGMTYHPLRQDWHTDDADLDVNYIVTARRPSGND